MKKYKIYLGANALVAIIAAGIIFGTITVFVGGSTVGTFTSTLGRDATLTGRTEVWAALLPVAMQQPVLGHGFGGFWTSETREVYQISGAHSGYLDVLLELGFVGLLLISIFLLSFTHKAQRELVHNFDGGSFWICYLLMFVLFNITESSITSFTNNLSAIFLFLAVSSTASTRHKPRVSQKT